RAAPSPRATASPPPRPFPPWRHGPASRGRRPRSSARPVPPRSRTSSCFASRLQARLLQDAVEGAERQVVADLPRDSDPAPLRRAPELTRTAAGLHPVPAALNSVRTSRTFVRGSIPRSRWGKKQKAGLCGPLASTVRRPGSAVLLQHLVDLVPALLLVLLDLGLLHRHLDLFTIEYVLDGVPQLLDRPVVAGRHAGLGAEQ